MNLAALSDFLLVASAGSLGKASRDSGRSKATLSRHVRQLEESLGVRLVERGRLAAEFAARYPQVHVDFIASDRYVDLIEEGFDVAVRVNPRPDSELVGRCFARDQMRCGARRGRRCALASLADPRRCRQWQRGELGRLPRARAAGRAVGAA